jgi:hypothetical protein
MVASRLDRRNLSNVKAPISPLAVDKKSDTEFGHFKYFLSQDYIAISYIQSLLFSKSSEVLGH